MFLAGLVGFVLMGIAQVIGLVLTDVILVQHWHVSRVLALGMVSVVMLVVFGSYVYSAYRVMQVERRSGGAGRPAAGRT